jgi:hypothetical protein
MKTAMDIAAIFVIGAAGWFSAAFIGGPIRRFFDLRGEVIRRMAELANVRARYKESRDNPNERETLQLSEAEIARLGRRRTPFAISRLK